MVRIAVVAEKPNLSRLVLPHIVAAHPNMDREAFVQVMANPVRDLDRSFDIHLDGPSRFPRGLSWKDFPIIREPVYRPFDLTGEGWGMPTSWAVRFGMTSDDRPRDTASNFAHEAIERFEAADVVYAAMDASSPSVHAFQRALEVLRPNAANDEAVRYPWTTDLSDVVLGRTIRDARSWTSVREEHLAHSIAKRRFTYNYALNAHAILGREMRIARASVGLADLPDGRIVASRNSLQLLYALRSLGRPMTDADIVRMMGDWRGTGRYLRPRYAPIMGSSSSRHQILTNLVEVGLVHSTGELPWRDLTISPLGEAYLDRLHPDCEDSDQGMRLENWRMLPLDESIPRIDRYLRTFFGKQKRYGAKVR